MTPDEDVTVWEGVKALVALALFLMLAAVLLYVAITGGCDANLDSTCVPTSSS